MTTANPSLMSVGQLLAAAFGIARIQQASLHKAWIDASHKIGGPLPNSLAMMSVQRAGELDLVLRCMESEFKPSGENPDDARLLAVNTQRALSELWIGSIYEVVRLIQDRKIASSDNLAALYNDLTLLRVPLMKHEIARERKMSEPLLFQKQPPNNNESDLYTYSREDPRRGHIMSYSMSARGSAGWQVIDIQTKEEYWLERLVISERFLSIFSQNPDMQASQTTL